MNKFFSLDNKVLIFCGKVGDLIILNTLWLLCCIPVITIVPATAALYYCTMKIVRGEETYIARMFFHSLKQNLKQGIVMSLIFAILAVFLYVDFQICFNLEGTLGSVLLTIFVILTVLVVMIYTYAVPLLAQFDNTTKGTLKNALAMSLYYFTSTFVMVILNVLPVAFYFWRPYLFLRLLPLWLFLAFALIARINSHFLVKIFDQYIPKDNDVAAEEDTEDAPEDLPCKE